VPIHLKFSNNFLAKVLSKITIVFSGFQPVSTGCACASHVLAAFVHGAMKFHAPRRKGVLTSFSRGLIEPIAKASIEKLTQFGGAKTANFILKHFE